MEQEREQATAQISYCQDLQRREEENLKASVKEQDKNLAIFLQGKKQRDLLLKGREQAVQDLLREKLEKEEEETQKRKRQEEDEVLEEAEFLRSNKRQKQQLEVLLLFIARRYLHIICSKAFCFAEVLMGMALNLYVFVFVKGRTFSMPRVMVYNAIFWGFQSYNTIPCCVLSSKYSCIYSKPTIQAYPCFNIYFFPSSLS